MNLPEIAPRHQLLVEQADKQCLAELRRILGLPADYDFITAFPKQAILSKAEFDAMQAAVKRDVVVRSLVNDLYREPGCSDVYDLCYIKTVIETNLVLTIKDDRQSIDNSKKSDKGAGCN